MSVDYSRIIGKTFSKIVSSVLSFPFYYEPNKLDVLVFWQDFSLLRYFSTSSIITFTVKLFFLRACFIIPRFSERILLNNLIVNNKLNYHITQVNYLHYINGKPSPARAYKIKQSSIPKRITSEEKSRNLARNAKFYEINYKTNTCKSDALCSNLFRNFNWYSVSGTILSTLYNVIVVLFRFVVPSINAAIGCGFLVDMIGLPFTMLLYTLHVPYFIRR